MASLQEFWNKEKLRLELELRLNGLIDHLQQQKVRIDSEATQLAPKKPEELSSEVNESEVHAPFKTESLFQINLWNTREYVGNTISMAASQSLAASRLPPTYDPLTQSQLSQPNLETMKTTIEHELLETISDPGGQLKNELLHLKTKLEELLIIIDSNSV
jgi:hypothetical protein